jgi:hypothetical protein
VLNKFILGNCKRSGTVANSIEIASVLEDQRMKVSHMERTGIYNYGRSAEVFLTLECMVVTERSIHSLPLWSTVFCPCESDERCATICT